MKSISITVMIIFAVPVMLFGCFSGWMFAAFMDGVKKGAGDWHEVFEPDKLSSKQTPGAPMPGEQGAK